MTVHKIMVELQDDDYQRMIAYLRDRDVQTPSKKDIGEFVNYVVREWVWGAELDGEDRDS